VTNQQSFQKTMRRFSFPTALIAAMLLAPATISAMPPLPEKFGQDLVMVMAESPKTWHPGNMYEHVNGEAELLKRYGARELLYAIYEQGVDRYLSVDLLDMGSAINAYGLYRLYAGCDGEEFIASGSVVLAGDWTYYAQREQYFLRMDVDTPDTKQTVTDFLAAFFGRQPTPSAPSEILDRLQKAAGNTCEVHYNPEDVDYNLKAGPGYTWTGPDGKTYHLRLLESAQEANEAAEGLSGLGARGVQVRGSLVAWPKETSEETDPYLENVLKDIGQ
jgi:hypothetical protein